MYGVQSIESGRDYLIHTADDVRVHRHNIQTCCIQSEDSLWPAGVSAQVSGFCKWTKSLFDDMTALFDNHRGTLVGPSALPIFYCKPRGADKPTQGKVTWGKVF